MLLPGDRKQEAFMGGLGRQGQHHGPIAAALHPARLAAQAGRARRRQQLVEQLEIRTPSLDQPVEFLSGGNQQKVSVSRLFSREPAVILAYEPTQGVDVGSRVDIYKALAPVPTLAPRSWSSRATPSSSRGSVTGYW